MSNNFVKLKGKITKDIVFGKTKGENDWARGNLAVESSYKAKGKKGKMCYIDFTCWGDNALFLSSSFGKGSAIIIEGELDLSSWEDKETKKKVYKHAVNCQRIELLGESKEFENEAVSKAKEALNSAVEESEIPF